jgi:hypothetical protein
MPDHPSDAYAFWTDPDSGYKITYSLAVFHEIDFYVSEGFRRIPHGGIELGGLLFGRQAANSAQIEAFRPIECEHAFGPSFILSERDLLALKQQLAAAQSDPELSGLQPLGWFIAHTRSSLERNERESAWFDRFFPSQGAIFVLAKPERFQATRFAFFVRSGGGIMPAGAQDHAIILPLPGRASGSQTGEPVPSIPAPKIQAVPAVPAAEKLERVSPVAQRPVPSEPEEALPPRRFSPQTGAPVPKKEAQPAQEPPPPVQPRYEVPNPPATMQPLPPLPRRIPPAEAPSAVADTVAEPPLKRAPTGHIWKLLLIFIVAAVLGSSAGYWAFIQIPPAVIPLSVRPSASGLIVSWPSDQTRGAAIATIRVNDGEPISLTDADKDSGQATIKAPGDDVKIELTVHHWMRESRGIVRFVTAAVPAAPAPAT